MGSRNVRMQNTGLANYESRYNPYYASGDINNYGATYQPIEEPYFSEYDPTTDIPMTTVRQPRTRLRQSGMNRYGLSYPIGYNPMLQSGLGRAKIRVVYVPPQVFGLFQNLIQQSAGGPFNQLTGSPFALNPVSGSVGAFPSPGMMPQMPYNFPSPSQMPYGSSFASPMAFGSPPFIPQMSYGTSGIPQTPYAASLMQQMAYGSPIIQQSSFANPILPQMPYASPVVVPGSVSQPSANCFSVSLQLPAGPSTYPMPMPCPPPMIQPVINPSPMQYPAMIPSVPVPQSVAWPPVMPQVPIAPAPYQYSAPVPPVPMGPPSFTYPQPIMNPVPSPSVVPTIPQIAPNNYPSPIFNNISQPTFYSQAPINAYNGLGSYGGYASGSSPYINYNNYTGLPNFPLPNYPMQNGLASYGPSPVGYYGAQPIIPSSFPAQYANVNQIQPNFAQQTGYPMNPVNFAQPNYYTPASQFYNYPQSSVPIQQPYIGNSSIPYPGWNNPYAGFVNQSTPNIAISSPNFQPGLASYGSSPYYCYPNSPTPGFIPPFYGQTGFPQPSVPSSNQIGYNLSNYYQPGLAAYGYPGAGTYAPQAAYPSWNPSVYGPQTFANYVQPNSSQNGLACYGPSGYGYWSPQQMSGFNNFGFNPSPQIPWQSSAPNNFALQPNAIYPGTGFNIPTGFSPSVAPSPMISAPPVNVGQFGAFPGSTGRIRLVCCAIPE